MVRRRRARRPSSFVKCPLRSPQTPARLLLDPKLFDCGRVSNVLLSLTNYVTLRDSQISMGLSQSNSTANTSPPSLLFAPSLDAVQFSRLVSITLLQPIHVFRLLSIPFHNLYFTILVILRLHIPVTTSSERFI